MDVFAALEERVEKLLSAHRALHERVAELEKENAKLKAGSQTIADLTERIAGLEDERNQARTRLEKLLANLSSLEL